MLKLYGLGCPKCNVLSKKMQQMGIEFEDITDKDTVMKFAEEHGFTSMPILADDNNVMDFTVANKYIMTLKR